jgi:DNA-binding CsgD family transcriptional regulator
MVALLGTDYDYVIANILKVPVSRVQRERRKRGIKPFLFNSANPAKIMWNDKVKFIKEGLLNLKSVQEIAEELKISRQRVHQILSANGLSVPEIMIERDKLLTEKIKQLASDKCTKEEIADSLKLSLRQVVWYCEKYEISEFDNKESVNP